MVIDDLRCAVADGLCEISARTRPESSEEGRLWFRFPDEFAPEGDLDASPFLCGVLLWAMRRGEDVTVDHPVSARLLENVEDIVAVYRSLHPEEMSTIAVSAPGRPLGPGRDMTASFFTRGVDSWFAVLTALEDDPQTPPLSHAVFSRGFLPTSSGGRLVEEKVAGTTEAARAAGLPTILFDTNVKRDFGGAAQLVSAAQALGFSRMLIPSGAMRGEIVPAGTHPILDHRFSTERTEIVHYGDASRIEKVARIARSALALDTVRVCRTDDAMGDVNCCECEKCLRTMLELHIVGALERSPAFGRQLDPRAVAGVTKQLKRRHQWLDILHSLGDSPLDRRLGAAARLVIARSDLLDGVAGLKELAREPELDTLAPELSVTIRRSIDAAGATHRDLGRPVGAPEKAEKPGKAGRDGDGRRGGRGRAAGAVRTVRGLVRGRT